MELIIAEVFFPRERMQDNSWWLYSLESIFFLSFFFSLFSISLQSTRNKALFTFLARPCVHVWSWYFKKRANNRTNKMKATFEHALTNSSVNTTHARVIFLLLLLFNLSDDNAIRIRIFLRRMINKVFLFLR